jgi:lysophospholipase L1-like esterase
MLGTNDLKARFHLPASEIAMGMQALVGDIRAARVGRDEGMPEVILVAPPPIRKELRGWEAVFAGGYEKSLQLAGEYRAVAEVQGCIFFDAGSVAGAGPVDGFHLDVASHRALGRALAGELKTIFGDGDA